MPPLRSETPLLRWLLPRLGLRLEGFDRVRGQVAKRMKRRMRELGLATLDAYRERLERDPVEVALAATFCRVTVSRFYRDREVFDALRSVELPALAARAGPGPVRAWSAGCASGEEPYTLRIVWDLTVGARSGSPALEVVATDAGAEVLERAGRALYERNAMKELPAELRDAAFVREGRLLRLKDVHRAGVSFRREDLRESMPEGPFDLVLCRNLAFTYFDPAVQRETLRRIVERMRPGSLLVIGAREALPASEGHRIVPARSLPGGFRLT